MNVVLVETDSADARVFSTFLKEQGHLCFITDSAKSARNLVRKECPGLVLLHLNGNTAQTLDFLDAARNMEPPVPVIVLTRKPKLDDAVQAVKKGAYDFWIKPFPMERLSEHDRTHRKQEDRAGRKCGSLSPGIRSFHEIPSCKT